LRKEYLSLFSLEVNKCYSNYPSYLKYKRKEKEKPCQTDMIVIAKIVHEEYYDKNKDNVNN
jgi:hypothetical protein